MQDYPHTYLVAAAAKSAGNVTLSSPGLPDLESAAPAEFGGPGDEWSPETLLVAAVADCFILSFKAIAKASDLDWHALSCNVDGVLEKVEKVTRFTGFNIRAALEVPEGTRESKAERLLEMAEKHCLITNSLIADSHLEAEVRISSAAAKTQATSHERSAP
ncbi:MAG: OsmC family protein [Gammaproteobacteria bacterium]|nr:OsmC family protein [Gammaproteobacteria bacterium]MDH3429806.1 OsmC family protein [Gammaproteobacteria bacterium]